MTGAKNRRDQGRTNTSEEKKVIACERDFSRSIQENVIMMAAI